MLLAKKLFFFLIITFGLSAMDHNFEVVDSQKMVEAIKNLNYELFIRAYKIYLKGQGRLFTKSSTKQAANSILGNGETPVTTLLKYSDGKDNKRRLKFVQLLVSCGADINQKNLSGQVPIQIINDKNLLFDAVNLLMLKEVPNFLYSSTLLFNNKIDGKLLLNELIKEYFKSYWNFITGITRRGVKNKKWLWASTWDQRPLRELLDCCINNNQLDITLQDDDRENVLSVYLKNKEKIFNFLNSEFRQKYPCEYHKIFNFVLRKLQVMVNQKSDVACVDNLTFEELKKRISKEFLSINKFFKTDEVRTILYKSRVKKNFYDLIIKHQGVFAQLFQ